MMSSKAIALLLKKLQHKYKILVVIALSLTIIVPYLSHDVPDVSYLSPEEIYTQTIQSWEQKIQDSERITTYHKLSDQQKTMMLKLKYLMQMAIVPKLAVMEHDA